MKKGVLLQMLYVLVYETYTTASYAMNTIDESLNFNGFIVENKPVFKFTYESVQRPIGDAVSFQVNSITVDVIRNSNNKCYDINNECRADTCLCYYDGVKFKMEYWYEVLNTSENFNFGVEMIFKDTNEKIVVVTLSRFYNGTDFEQLEIVKETNQYKFMENTVKLGNTLESGASNEWVLKVVSTSVALSLVVIVSVLCIRRYYNRTKEDESEESKPCISETPTIKEAVDEERKSVFDLLVADNEPLKDKSYDFSAVNKSFSKKMPYINIDEDTGHRFVTGRIVSEGQIKIKSGMKPPPGVRECPEDIIIQSPVLVQEKEGAYQSVSSCSKGKPVSVPGVFEKGKTFTSNIATKEGCLSNESSNEDRGSVIDVLVADEKPLKDKAFGFSQEYLSFGRRVQSFSERMRYFENQKEINQSIDAERTDSEGKHDITSGIEPPPVFCQYAEDGTIQSSVLVQERENVNKSISNQSAHGDRVSGFWNLLDADHEPAKDKSFGYNQVNKSLSKSMQIKDNKKEIIQSSDFRRTYSEGQINITSYSFQYPDDETIQSSVLVQEQENKHPSISNKSAHEDRVSGFWNLLDADHEPAKDKSFGYNQVNKSLSKSMLIKDNKKEIIQSSDFRRTYSEGQINITSYSFQYPDDETIQSSVLVQEQENKHPSTVSRCPIENLETESNLTQRFRQFTLRMSNKEQCISCVFCEDPADETIPSPVTVQERENEYQSGSCSFHQIDKDYDTIDVSSDFDEMEPDHQFEFLDEDNVSEDDKSEFRNKGSSPFEDSDSEEDSSDFEEIDFEETVNTGLMDKPLSDHDECNGMQPYFKSTSEQFMRQESAHVNRDSVINISKIDEEPATDKSLIFRQLNKTLSKRMQYSDNIEDADQSVDAVKAHPYEKNDIGPPLVFCENYQVETLQLSVYDGKGFHLSCPYERFEDDDDDPFSDSVLRKIVEEDFECYQGLVPFEDTVLKDAYFNFLQTGPYERFEDDDDDPFSDSVLKKIVEEDFECYQGLVPFEDSVLEDACYNFVQIETEYTPPPTKNKENALFMIGAIELGNSCNVRSVDKFSMRGLYLKDCQSTFIWKTATERQLEFKTTANTVNGAPTINCIVNAISILGSMKTHDIAVPYNTLKDFDRRIELLIHSTICRSLRYHICSCVNRQDSKLGDDVLQHFFLYLKHRKPNLMLQHG